VDEAFDSEAIVTDHKADAVSSSEGDEEANGPLHSYFQAQTYHRAQFLNSELDTSIANKQNCSTGNPSISSCQSCALSGTNRVSDAPPCKLRVSIVGSKKDFKVREYLESQNP
jgi:hypothetical protein